VKLDFCTFSTLVDHITGIFSFFLMCNIFVQLGEQIIFMQDFLWQNMRNLKQ